MTIATGWQRFLGAKPGEMGRANIPVSKMGRRRMKNFLDRHLLWHGYFFGTVVYLDSPYPGNHVNYLHNMRAWELHEKMIRWMQRAQYRVILSSYDREDIRQQVHDFTVIPVSLVSAMGPERKNREILVTNFELPRLIPIGNNLSF